MPQAGTLRRWNDDRGYGFIAPADGGPEVFVHVSAFSRDGTRPTVGETLLFELGASRNGKPQAVRVTRPGAPRPDPRPPRDARVRTGSGAHGTREPGSHWVGSLIVMVLVAGIGVYGYRHFKEASHRRDLAGQVAPPRSTEGSATGAPSLRCDGRTHCNQMTSCAEATWFINHCPGTRMDGNNDGVPCEQQWCTSVLAR